LGTAFSPARCGDIDEINPGLTTMIDRFITLPSEAARYDFAIRTIAGVASMRLENPQELTAALAILDEQLTHLKLHRSKLLSLVLGDYIFTRALKKVCPDRAAAEAFIRELRANPQAVFKLRGAHALGVRMMESVRADVRVLRRTAQHLRKANASSGSASNSDDDWDPYAHAQSVFPDMALITALIAYLGFVAAFDSMFSHPGISEELNTCYLRASFNCLACLQKLTPEAARPSAEPDGRRNARCIAVLCDQLAQCLAPPRMRRALPWGELPFIE